MGLMPTIGWTVAAIAIFAIGESVQAPRFYEYVSRLAPPEQVGTYMGFAFLPIADRYVLLGVVERISRRALRRGGNPDAPKMWFVVGSYGVVATLLLLVYDRLIAPRRRRGLL